MDGSGVCRDKWRRARAHRDNGVVLCEDGILHRDGLSKEAVSVLLAHRGEHLQQQGGRALAAAVCAVVLEGVVGGNLLEARGVDAIAPGVDPVGARVTLDHILLVGTVRGHANRAKLLVLELLAARLAHGVVLGPRLGLRIGRPARRALDTRGALEGARRPCLQRGVEAADVVTTVAHVADRQSDLRAVLPAPLAQLAPEAPPRAPQLRLLLERLLDALEVATVEAASAHEHVTPLAIEAARQREAAARATSELRLERHLLRHLRVDDVARRDARGAQPRVLGHLGHVRQLALLVECSATCGTQARGDERHVASSRPRASAYS